MGPTIRHQPPANDRPPIMPQSGTMRARTRLARCLLLPDSQTSHARVLPTEGWRIRCGIRELEKDPRRTAPSAQSRSAKSADGVSRKRLTSPTSTTTASTSADAVRRKGKDVTTVTARFRCADVERAYQEDRAQSIATRRYARTLGAAFFGAVVIYRAVRLLSDKDMVVWTGFTTVYLLLTAAFCLLSRFAKAFFPFVRTAAALLLLFHAVALVFESSYLELPTTPWTSAATLVGPIALVIRVDMVQTTAVILSYLVIYVGTLAMAAAHITVRVWWPHVFAPLLIMFYLAFLGREQARLEKVKWAALRDMAEENAVSVLVLSTILPRRVAHELLSPNCRRLADCRRRRELDLCLCLHGAPSRPRGRAVVARLHDAGRLARLHAR